MGNLGGSEGKGGIIDALETLVENLRKECYSKFANREHLELNELKL